MNDTPKLSYLKESSCAASHVTFWRQGLKRLSVALSVAVFSALASGSSAANYTKAMTFSATSANSYQDWSFSCTAITGSSTSPSSNATWARGTFSSQSSGSAVSVTIRVSMLSNNTSASSRTATITGTIYGNTYSVTVTQNGTSATGKPNLAFITPSGWPSSVYLSSSASGGSPTTAFATGSTIYLFAAFANTGTSSAGACVIAAAVTKSGSSSASYNTGTIPALVPYSQSKTYKQLTGFPILENASAGTYTVYIALDDDEVIAESNEGDNIKQITFTVSTPILSPVYRFYSSSASTHFYTGNAGEAHGLRNGSPAGWNYEGVAYYAYTRQVSGTVPLYRFYSPVYRGHFFTRNEAEMQSLRKNSSATWRYEGVAYYVAPSQVSGTVPVYRFWNPVARHHFYTRNANEAHNLRYKITSKNYNYEGVAFYAWQSAASSYAYAAIAKATAPDEMRSGGASGKEETSVAGIRLETDGGETIVADSTLETNGGLLESRTELPDADELSTAPDGTGASVMLRLVAPEGSTVGCWNSAAGEIGVDLDETGVFALPADGSWNWLRASAPDGETFSIWIRATRE